MTSAKNRVDNTVYFGNIGIGEKVHVKTLMGNHVCVGDVVLSSPFGVMIKENASGNEAFFSGDLYLFSVEEAEPPTVVVNDLSGMSPDERVAFKLKKMVESDSEDGKEKKDKESDNGGEEDGKLDIDKLPDAIKKSITTVGALSGDKLNSVLSDIGEAALRALKRVGVREDELFGFVSQIQKSVAKVLESEKK